MNVRYKLMRFLSGRYGVDHLFWVLFGAAFCISVVNMFIGFWPLNIFVYILEIFAIFRVFSRNYSARSRENSLVEPIFAYFKRRKEFSIMKKNDPYHFYKRCKYCKAILRLPNNKGKHRVNCPKCQKAFKVKV